MAKTIALVNQKGGVGKTTTTLNFGAALAEKGYKVLLVDFDYQANLTQYCGINGDELAETVATGIRKIMYDQEIGTFPIHSYRDNLHIIPASIVLAEINTEMILATARELLLRKYLRPIKDQYDYILIDCHPSLSVDLINALTAADEVLIISNPELFSTIGAVQLMNSISKIRNNLNEDLTIAGILCNMVDNRTNFTRDMLVMLRETWGEGVKIFDTEIPASVRVKESQAAAMPVIEYERENKAAQSFLLFTGEYLKGACK